MTEQEWMDCDNPHALLSYLQSSDKANERRLRLFACACVRRIWDLLPTDDCRRAVEVAEMCADRLAGAEELEAASTEAYFSATPQAGYVPRDVVVGEIALSAVEQLTSHTDPWECVLGSSDYAREAVGGAPGADSADRGAQCDLIRDILGNPFRPAALDPAWRTPDVVSLAQAAYEERILPAGILDSDRLAVLADALEDAGCDNAAILSHLRSPGQHVRGCWAVDLLLSRD